jgi:hypothetical protein
MLNPDNSTDLGHTVKPAPCNGLATALTRSPRLSHWLPYDALGIVTGRARALCGTFIRVADHARTPSCPACVRALADTDRWLDAETTTEAPR